jgi:hypothetical protein
MFVPAVEDDIEAVKDAAKHIRTLYRKGILNPLSSLPEPKTKLKQAIKERIRILAASYISLASFIDDDELAFVERNPKSKKTRAIYLKVIRDMEKAKNEMRRFKIIP